jgi:DNA modification methylase
MINLLQGDCLEQMKQMEANSVDAIVSDPPYGISFMAKKWDYDVPSVEVWKEAMRVLKPGGHALIACGTRTQHRMVVNIEDAGFEIRDVVSWVYGCLSDDTEILIDGQWEPYHKAIGKGHALTYNIETDSFQWEQIQELVTYDYNDTAYRIHSDNTDQIVSRNHRCIVERSGGKAFAYAETLERQEGVPVLEDLPRLLESLPVPHKRASNQKQVVQGLPQEKHGAMEQRQETGKAGVRSLQSDVLPHRAEQEQAKDSLQSGVQREATGSRIGEAFTQGACGLDGQVARILCGENDRREQSGMEGRCDVLSETRQLQADQIRPVSDGVSADGEERRLCDGTSFDSSASDGKATATSGGRASQESRPTGQQDRKSRTVCNQQGPQTVRASRHATTDMAIVEPIHYEGIVWCVRVPSGAFVARRNGKVFVTGNSGFPKSLNVSKAIDKCNGDPDRLERFTAWMRTTGIKSREIDEITGTNMGGHYLTAKSQPAIPTAALWTKLRPHITIEIPKWVDELVDRIEAEREVVGSETKARSTSGNSALPTMGGDTVYQSWNITAPATEAAKQWDGWGTALKPACEFFTLCRKPLSEKTIAANVLKWGTGGINIDGCRVGTEDTGRFPANLIHDGSPEVLGLFPETKSGALKPYKENHENASSYSMARDKTFTQSANSGSAARFFYCPKASKKDRDEGLEGFEEKKAAGMAGNMIDGQRLAGDGTPINTPKRKNTHPTVKPTTLMAYLCRLITPPGGVVLDPYMGSGSTGKAAVREGFGFVGCELDPDYFKIATARVENEQHQPDEQTKQCQPDETPALGTVELSFNF